MSGKRGSKPTEYVVNILEVRACFVLLVVLNRLFILVYAILYLDLHLFSRPRWPIISEKVVPSNQITKNIDFLQSSYYDSHFKVAVKVH